ncbi:MAG: hypothetical protein WAU15_09210 [Nitrosomonas sp.]
MLCQSAPLGVVRCQAIGGCVPPVGIAHINALRDESNGAAGVLADLNSTLCAVRPDGLFVLCHKQKGREGFPSRPCTS